MSGKRTWGNHAIGHVQVVIVVDSPFFYGVRDQLLQIETTAFRDPLEEVERLVIAEAYPNANDVIATTSKGRACHVRKCQAVQEGVHLGQDAIMDFANTCWESDCLLLRDLI